MFRLKCLLFLLLILIVSNQSRSDLLCPNGRLALRAFDIYSLRFTANCSRVGQVCGNRKGKCSEENLCCPPTLKMSSKSRLYDRVTNIRFNRIGEDYNQTYRLYEIHLLSNKYTSDNNQERWNFFDYTLRDLFEMPNAQFWYSIKNCLENYGITYAFVPLNATSVTANISAMTILTRRNTSMDSLYVCYMATRKEHRRRGLGTRLLQQIVSRALDEQINGIKHLILHVNTLNTVALELYERCGWRCYEYLPGYLNPDPYHTTNHAYTLKLDLENVKNLKDLCRNANAVNINPLDNEKSLNACKRTPVQL